MYDLIGELLIPFINVILWLYHTIFITMPQPYNLKSVIVTLPEIVLLF